MMELPGSDFAFSIARLVLVACPSPIRLARLDHINQPTRSPPSPRRQKGLPIICGTRQIS